MESFQTRTAISRIPIDPREDRTNILKTAVAAIPPEPAWILPPPPDGMRWASTPAGAIQPSEALDGEWTPATRPHLSAVIAYMATPEAAGAIDMLKAIPPGGCRLPKSYPKEIRRAVRFLAVHARIALEEHDDLDTAIDDLMACLWLSQITCFSGDALLIMTGQACEFLALDQLRVASMEKPFSHSQLIRCLSAIDELSEIDQLWAEEVGAWTEDLNQALNLTYTLDDDENGFLALRCFNSLAVGTVPSPEPRIGAWNTLSVLFNSRTAVQKKIDSIRKSMTSAYAGSFADCREFLTREGNKSPFNILDGPIWRLSPLEHVHYRLRTLFNMAAARSATRASLALSCYRHDRGEYPESISELVPQWLSEIPRDSFTDQALGYARLPDVDDYIIYSVGSDLVDDKGKRRSRVGQDADDNTTYDIVYDHVRGKQLWAESKLERISK